MHFPNWLDVALLKEVLIAVPVVLLGWWFLFRHEIDPGTELTVDVVFAGRQDSQWLIEVVAILANRGAVKQVYRDFEVKIRYLMPGDSVVDGGEKIERQLLFPNFTNTRISGAKRFFAHSAYINPKLTFRHSYVTSVPEAATFVWVSCKFVFRTREHWYSILPTEHEKSTQRLFHAPFATQEVDGPSAG